MFSLKMITFCKSVDCPTSQDLLSFQKNASNTGNRASEIRRHLSVCEFCTSEVEFYAHYPQAEEKVGKVEIPLPLKELAQALLTNKHKDFSMLNHLLGEKETVKA